jgi:hypothetical protein
MIGRRVALGIWAYGAWVLLTWTPFTWETEGVGVLTALVVAHVLAPFGEVARPWLLLEDAPCPVELRSVDPLLYSGGREDSRLVGQHR